MDNLTLLAILIILLWAGALVFYFRLVGQQKKLSQQIEKLRKQIDDAEKEHLD